MFYCHQTKSITTKWLMNVTFWVQSTIISEISPIWYYIITKIPRWSIYSKRNQILLYFSCLFYRYLTRQISLRSQIYFARAAWAWKQPCAYFCSLGETRVSGEARGEQADFTKKDPRSKSVIKPRIFLQWYNCLVFKVSFQSCHLSA